MLERESHPPEERRWFDKFEAYLGSTGVPLTNKGHPARKHFHGPRVDHCDLLPSYDFFRKSHHAAMCVNGGRMRFFGEGQMPV
jgi:hypothetical protein